ncbi:phage shock protein PspC (stress-responsive transcriptional regulator) [Fontibacillus solani]|uniref:Phage shock protein PspC (Stress-responsive transcriptional regulator) n=2 Tax=Fontibacillus TaxID=995014 RepID=A0A1G7ITL2_9BACL|nr:MULTISPECIES: PspC domain-containing protein [Fontibacillus]MBA9087127.1 phage shock protein PspC (stress-responsive transcriptional regulator) [Fontibacillus solani]SDF15649.1 Phage shock protein PspC (stress-responsive transcriptional regulator) [Fontibacillus panacisegetis]
MANLYRSRRDRWVSGLLGGLGEYFGISTTALRILTLVSIPFTGGTTIFIYLIAALVISKEPYQPFDPYHNGGWQRGCQGGNNYGFGAGPGSQRGPQGFNEQPPFGGNSYPGGSQQYNGPHNGPQKNAEFASGESSNLDSMMQDIEKKAMKKELEELRQKLAKYEKGEV